jgi:hypothetical protein
VARFNHLTNTWAALGSGITSTLPFPGVEALLVFDDGRGEDLYVGGQFQMAGGQPASNIARWNGTSWSALNGGIGFGDTIAAVYSLGVFDHDLFAGGNFTHTGGGSANYVARWNGCTQCAADLFPAGGDGVIGSGDLAELLSQWGACPAPCDADLAPVGEPDGMVGPSDLAQLLASWGECS